MHPCSIPRVVLVVVTSTSLGLVGCATSAPSNAATGGVELAQPNSPTGQVARAYSADGLRRAFADVCQRLGYRAMRVEVDESEFPFLLYGVLEGSCDYGAIRDAVSTVPGYAYGGSVTLGARNGALTLFALNMTPAAEYGGDRAMSGQVMTRLSALAQSQR
jgi:hypothetical protein